MRQTTRFLLHTAAFSTAFLVLSASAWAQTVTGTAWMVSGNEPTLTSTAPGVAAEGSFTATSIDFSTATTGADSTQTPAGFLNMDEVLDGFLFTAGATTSTTISNADLAQIMSGGGSTPNCTAVSNLIDATGCSDVASTEDVNGGAGCYGSSPGGSRDCYSTVLEITGFATFTAGTTYTITHDDGIIGIVNGSIVAPWNEPNPVAATPSSWTPGTTETDVPFTIWYQGTNGNPEILTANFTLDNAPTPEPGSVSMLFTMLAGFAGLAFTLRKKLT